MTKSILSPVTAKVQILTAILCFVNITGADQINNDRVSGAAMSQFIANYVRPFVRRLQIESISDDEETIEDAAIERTIEQKIIELGPRLDERTDNPVTPQDVEDTKILELTDNKPNIVIQDTKSEPLKGHISKYKMLRRRIEDVLKTEQISHKTNALVTETLDQMITQLLSSQCTWNRAEEKQFRSHYPLHDKQAMINSWKSRWQDLIQQYSAGSNNKDADGLGYKEMLFFLVKLREFFFEIHDELNMQNDRYKVKCQLVDDGRSEPPKKFSIVNQRDVLRESPKIILDTDDHCKHIRICSQELKHFLMDFYINLKETVDVAFRNYEEMYKRDVNTVDSREKRTFVALMKDTNSIINEKIGKSFKKQTEKLKLDTHNNTREKIDAINVFLKSTVDLLQKTIGKVLAIQLKSLDSKMRSTVKQDLVTTLAIELSNLNKHFSDKICLVFQTCNGNATRRGVALKRNKLDTNDIYMKLKLGFNHPTLRRSVNIRTLNDEAQDRAYNRYQPPSTMKTTRLTFDARKYMNVSVTRTTYRVPVKRIRRIKVKKAAQLTTITTTKSTTTKGRTTTMTTTTKAPTTTTSTTKSEATTTKTSSTTYTYGDYVKKMIAAGKMKKPTTPRPTTTKQQTMFRKFIGSFIY